MKAFNINIKGILVFLLVGTSTMPIFKQSFGIYLLLGSMIFAFKGLRITKEALWFLLFTFAIELYHNFYFDTYDIGATRQAMYGLFAAIVLIYYLRLDFVPLFVNLLYYFALISFPIFLLWYADSNLVNQLAHAIPSVFVKTSEKYGETMEQINPFIYNFDGNFLELGRNNGPFWEPTVFATMLMIAQFFNLLLTKKLFNKKGIVFSIAILTTFSTTGFMAYFLLIVFYFLLSDRIRTFTKVIMVTGSVAVSVLLFTSLPFLSEKIDNEIEKTDHEIDKFGGDSRLASAMLDMQEISEKPEYIILGKGLSSDRIAGPDKDVLRNCGDTGLLISWGAIYFVIYLGLLFYSFLEMTRHYGISWIFAAVFTAIILIFGFSEVYFNLPFFYVFLFIGFIIRRFYTAIQPAPQEYTEILAY